MHRPGSCKPYIRNPDPLRRLQPVPPGGRVSYVAVVTQYERKKGIYFTLRAHCLAPVALVELPPLYAFQEPPVLGEWPDSSLGVGAANACPPPATSSSLPSPLSPTP
mmetsp:Transcript_29183/g.93263  ORF Transcript_29183/g.93263 Transcript_29183/m.93263 type:complete len:107 (+) Transcript_29183:46-366(+)